ncbi:acyl-CoA thioesterase [Demequina soli]|uniref:acyl-CoA thioesterase n=1 Tax=Demequina soli TaxID=1638987 RepID=UPI00078030AC|nr:thioesterase family protein [Demequina soli]
MTVSVELRWADVDLNGHVNNVAYLVLLEEVRIRALHPVIRAASGVPGPLAATGRATVVVGRHEIEYLRQLTWWPAPVRVELWVARIGTASVDVHHAILPPAGAGEEPYAHAATTLVYLDPATQRSRPLTGAERQAFEPLLDAPLAFRRAPVPT